MTTNDVLENLVNDYHEERLSHAYLIETNNLGKAIDDVKYLIKNIICPNDFNINCSKCNLCHLMDNNSIPSILFIYPDGRSIKKDQIELIKTQFSNKSLYTKYSIYVIIEPELMNETAFNRMLKFIEEPEDDIIGFFITSNKDKVADTILSRLACVKMSYTEDNYIVNNTISTERKEEIDRMCLYYISNILNIDELLCYNINVIQKGITEKSEIVYFFNKLLDCFKNELNKDYNKYCKLSNIVINYLDRLNYNVNIPLLLDSFVVEMEQVYEE